MKKLLLALPLLVVSSIALAAYEDHFPTYFEYCTGTQWKLQNGEKGGVGGHGFTYIQGLCKDYRSEYPKVIPCSEVSADLKAKYPHEGVGISLDKNFSNVMWVAVPGRELTIFGDKEKKAITKADLEEHAQRITELKVFNEVISKSAKLKPYTFGTPEYLHQIAKDTAGTDHAVNWARDLHCVRIPAHKSSLINVTKFLNESNNKYKTGPGYEWKKLSNNCVHLSLNTSNAMGINDSIKLDTKYIQLLFNIALPANGFMRYADETVLAKLPSNRKLAKTLKEKNFSPIQVGAIMEVHHAYPAGEVYNTNDLDVQAAPRVSKPLKLMMTPKKYEQKLMTPKNTKLKENAEMWVERYEKALKKLSRNQRNTEVETYLMRQLELSKKIAAEE